MTLASPKAIASAISPSCPGADRHSPALYPLRAIPPKIFEDRFSPDGRDGSLAL